MQLFVESGTFQTFLFELISAYLKLQERNKVKFIYLSKGAIKANKLGNMSIYVPMLVTSKGDILNEVYPIACGLFQILPQWKTFFLGVPDEAQAKQVESIYSHLKQGKQLRKYLQKHLQPRTFFVGNHITYADLFMFASLYDNVVEMSDQQKIQYNNLFRWYKHVQNLPQIKQYLLKNKRSIVQDPVPKYPFLNQKKKSKKDKQEKKEQKKQKQQYKQIKKQTKIQDNKEQKQQKSIIADKQVKQVTQTTQQKTVQSKIE